MITKERAEELRRACWAAGGWKVPGMTADEERTLKDLWKGIPGRWSFYDLLNKLSRGEYP